MGAVWVTRSGAGGERTRAFLVARGRDAVHVPLVAITWRAPDPAPATPWPDRVVFVSANAVEGFVRALVAAGHDAEALRGTTRAAAVGERTAAAARRSGFEVDLVPAEQRAGGLVEGFDAIDLAGRRVWIPAGSEAGSATGELPAVLRARGAVPTVLEVYSNEPRLPDARESALLAACTPGAIVLHSPSAARALVAALAARPEIAAWRAAAVLAIGPVTAAEVRRLDLPPPLESGEPSDEGILDLLDRLGSIRMTKE